jgi:hypothetical protein
MLHGVQFNALDATFNRNKLRADSLSKEAMTAAGTRQ